MRKVSVKSVEPNLKVSSSSGDDDCYPVPELNGQINSRKAVSSKEPTSSTRGGYAIESAFLDGNYARRKHPTKQAEYTIWDTELKGFGLRVLPSGSCFWMVRSRQRGKHIRITLGRPDEVAALLARTQARRLLAEAAVDGLPKQNAAVNAITLEHFVDMHWNDVARYWKPSTAKRNFTAWRVQLAPVFGAMRISEVRSTNVRRWRDDCAGDQESQYNRAIPVLGSLFKYAEALNLRRKGSNPCRGLPRYRRAAKERYLSPVEYSRLGAALRATDDRFPSQVAIVRLLLFTGARISEIRDLRWEWVRPPHLLLPDSKTGLKTIWLNSQALAVLASIPRREGCPLVFPNMAGTKPLTIDPWWSGFRLSCSMPDLRLHDLRHSFASTAIMDNVPLVTIGKLLGHVLPETTAKYAHLADEVIGDAAQRISGSLAQALGLRP
jgi:integrase